MRIVKNYINGVEVSKSTKLTKIYDPSTGEHQADTILSNAEDFEIAIKRELFEELGIKIDIKNLISLDVINHSYDKRNFIIMNVFLLKKWSGVIKKKDAQDFKWIKTSGPYPEKFLEGEEFKATALHIASEKLTGMDKVDDDSAFSDVSRTDCPVVRSDITILMN